MAQLSAMKHVVTHGCVPYADFGVFGPHAIRMMRKLRLTGLIMLGPSGELFRSEMAGPMTYDQWEACFMVFRSAMVMLEFASRLTRPRPPVQYSVRDAVLGSYLSNRYAGQAGARRASSQKGKHRAHGFGCHRGQRGVQSQAPMGVRLPAASSRVCFLEARAGGSSLVDPSSCSGGSDYL